MYYAFFTSGATKTILGQNKIRGHVANLEGGESKIFFGENSRFSRIQGVTTRKRQWQSPIDINLIKPFFLIAICYITVGTPSNVKYVPSHLQIDTAQQKWWLLPTRAVVQSY